MQKKEKCFKHMMPSGNKPLKTLTNVSDLVKGGMNNWAKNVRNWLGLSKWATLCILLNTTLNSQR